MNSVMIALEPCRYIQRKGYGSEKFMPIKKALPFAESARGEYTHRVRHVSLFIGDSIPRLGIECWCAMHLLVAKGKFGRLVPEPSEGRPICATCEGRAIGAGLLGAREIAGRPVMYRGKGAA